MPTPRTKITPAIAVFLFSVAFHGLFQTGFLAQLIVAPSQALAALQVPADALPGLTNLLTLTMAGQALLVILCGYAMLQTWRGQRIGLLAGFLIGVYFLLLGIALWWRLGELRVLNGGLDIVRGGLTVVSGSLALRQFADTRARA